jgi:hypothetical protein
MNDIFCQYYEDDGACWLIHTGPRNFLIQCLTKNILIAITAAEAHDGNITYHEESAFYGEAEVTEGYLEADHCTLAVGTKVYSQPETCGAEGWRTGYAELNGRGFTTRHKIPYRVAVIAHAVAQGRDAVALIDLGARRVWPGPPDN